MTWTDPNDYAVACDFYLRTKAIFVCSKNGENIVVTSQLQQFTVFGAKRLQISKLLFFDIKGVDMIAIGLRSGVGILKSGESLLSDKEEARIIPSNYEEPSRKMKGKLSNSM